MQHWIDFISADDITALRFLPLWEQLRVHTPMGERIKRECRPYRISERAIWQRDMDEVQRMRAVAKDVEQYRLHVKGMVDISPILQAWLQDSIPQRMDWFHIKGFLLKGLRVLSLPKWEVFWDRFPEHTKKRWLQVLALLSPSPRRSTYSSDSFQLEALFPDHFHPLLIEKQQLEQEKQRLLIARQQRIEQALGFTIGQKNPFYIPRRETDKITALEQHGAFVKVKETPFDVAFAWSMDEDEHILLQREEEIEQRWQQVEQQAIYELASMVLPYREELLLWVESFGKLDFTYAKACLAETYQGTIPTWQEGDQPIALHGGIHPWLAEQWSARGHAFTPVDIQLHPGEVAVIIGENMGGKSVAMKTLGLCVLMAQLGLPVPAQALIFSPIDGIVLIGGEYEQLESGLSSFGGEVQQLCSLFSRSREKRWLVLCDEIGRGTNPEEGEALAIAIAEELGDTSWYTCFVSHYSRVVQVPRIRIYQISSHRLISVENGVVPRKALQIAEQMGLPTAIIQRAVQVLEQQ